MISEALANSSGSLADPEVRRNLVRLEDKLKGMPQVDIPVNHFYSGGVYAREIVIPAGVALTGRIYKDDHIDIMVSGEMVVTTEGEESKHIEGFNIVESKQGKKRAGYAIKDTHWITVHLSSECEDEKYIDEVSVETFQEFDQYVSSPKYIDENVIMTAFAHSKEVDYEPFKAGYLSASGCEISEDREDYLKALGEYGFDEHQVRVESEIQADIVPVDVSDVYLGQSKIEGYGLFCRCAFDGGDVIMPASIDGKRTIAGRYTNHAKDPNAEFVFEDNNVMLVALKDISNEEITVDYRESMKNRIEDSLCQA